MDYLFEGIALGFDLIILSSIARSYIKEKDKISIFKSLPELDQSLLTSLKENEIRKVPLCFVHGVVRPISSPPLFSNYQSQPGVIQKISHHEHRLLRSALCFWTEHRRKIHETWDSVPFELVCDDTPVKICNTLMFEEIDMKVTYNHFEPVALSIWGHIASFFTGNRLKGVHTVEEMLPVGKYMTGIGELQLDGNKLLLTQSKYGVHFLKNMTKSEFLEVAELQNSNKMKMIIVTGGIAIILISLIGLKFYKKLKIKWKIADERCKLQAKIKEMEEEVSRLAIEVKPLNKCVVCLTDPQQIALHPCGHVCICSRCSERIGTSCPVCRRNIQNMQRIYFA